MLSLSVTMSSTAPKVDSDVQKHREVSRRNRIWYESGKLTLVKPHSKPAIQIVTEETASTKDRQRSATLELHR